MSAADEWWVVPPGYRRLADVVQEHGRDHTQTKLISRQWLAFEFDVDTGDLRPIPMTVWCAANGRWWLERAENPNDSDGGAIFTDHWFVVVVRITEEPPRTDEPSVRFAWDLMQERFPQGEWRTMGPTAVRHACQFLAEKRGRERNQKPPGVDSYARAMGRRKKSRRQN